MGVLDDGGYQLAIELEGSCAWRPWLGEQLYSELRLHLISSSAWAAFMNSSDSANPSHLRLQLRVRALLYDKALDFPESPVPSSHINRSFFQLQPDNVYFSLEQDACDWTRLQNEGSSSMLVLQAKYGLDNRDTLSKQQKLIQRKISANAPKQGRNSPGFRNAEQNKSIGEKSMGSDLWYDQWFDKNLTERMHRLARRLAQHKLPFGEQEALKRTSEGMAAFSSLCSRARKRHQLVTGDPVMLKLERELETGDNDLSILPELTSASSSVPENPCPAAATPAGALLLSAEKAESEAQGLSSQFLGKGAGSSKSQLTTEEAELISRKTVAKILESHGFEGVRQIPLDILSEVMVSHIQKLGGWLRIILDSYQKHLSPDEFLRMFVQKLVSYHSRVDHPESGGSIRDLADYVKGERLRSAQASQVLPVETQAMMQQYQQLPIPPQSRQFAALQQSMYIENVLKKKQLPALRANKMREELGGAIDMKPYATMGTQPWISQQMPSSNHSQVLQHLKQQLQLPTIQQITSKQRIDGLHEVLGSDVMKQESSDDLEGTLGSPNKRKRNVGCFLLRFVHRYFNTTRCRTTDQVCRLVTAPGAVCGCRTTDQVRRLVKAPGAVCGSVVCIC